MSPEWLHARLTADLQAAGTLPARWKPTFEAVPRHLFIPDTVWVEADAGWLPLSRHDSPDEWWDLVYRDGYVVTQVDDGRAPEPGAVGNYSTSSASQPRLVMRMLRHLDPRPDDRVLEIGTGSGYNAALLADRVGPANVTTVEIDAGLAERARESLAEAGFEGTVVAVGDGAAGWEPRAPYDRVVSTASVRQVPYAWVAQTRPGGVIVTPWGNGYHNDALVRLIVAADGTASGRFVGSAAFMWMRDDRVILGPLGDYVHDGDRPERCRTRLDPRTVFGRGDVDFAIGTRVPDCSWHRFDSTGEPGEFTVWLVHIGPGERSWASVDYEAGGPHLVEQYGPRRLWDEVAAAYEWWVDAGRPPRERFGFTVTPEAQRVWLDDSAGRSAGSGDPGQAGAAGGSRSRPVSS